MSPFPIEQYLYEADGKHIAEFLHHHKELLKAKQLGFLRSSISTAEKGVQTTGSTADKEVQTNVSFVSWMSSIPPRPTRPTPRQQRTFRKGENVVIYEF